MGAVRRSLVGGLLLAAGVARGAAAQAIPVRVGGEASSLVGVPLQVPIEVDLSARPEVKLGSFSLVIRWNPAVLRFDRGENGTFGNVFAYEDSLPLGVARLVGANPGGVGGRVVLGIAHFTPIADAVDTFRLQVTELYAASTFADLLPSAVWADRLYCTARGRFGDVNSNQATNGQDALLVLSHAVGIDISAQGLPLLGDVDGDGVTGARDALIILSAAVGLDVSPFRVLRIAAGPCGDARRPTFQVSPSTVAMDLGQAARLIAVARDSLGNGLAATDVAWTTSDPAVATVSAVGVVVAVAAGNATITATRLGASSASATIAVSDRRVHWVDAFAFAADSDQIGAPELPFQTIPQAVTHAQPGDTIKVRSGRYEGGVGITKPVVIMGDTAGGRPRPLIAATGVYTQGFLINTGGRVELHDVRVDTLYQGVNVTFVDTLLVRGVEFRTPSVSLYGAIYVDSAGALLVQRSSFFGARTSYYYYAHNAIWASPARVVSIDSTIISDYGGDGVYLAGTDSLFVRHSLIRNNYGYGIYACTSCFSTGSGVAAVLTGNRFVQNSYGHLWLDQIRSTRLDHNHMVGGGYDAIRLYGDSLTTQVSLRRDTILTFGFGIWLHLDGFDSLTVDSATVQTAGGGESFYNGRVAVVSNSRFVGIQYGTALDVQPYYRASTRLVLRNVQFSGSAECDRCTDGVSSYDTEVDADGVTGTNLSDLFNVNGGSLRARNVTLSRAYYGVYRYCGSAWIDRMTTTDVQSPIYATGCSPDSLVVDSSSFSLGNRAITSYNNHAVVTNTTISNFVWGIDADYLSLAVADNQLVSVKDGGIEYFGVGQGPALIFRNTITCQSPPYPYVSTAIRAFDAIIGISDNTISGCSAGIEGYNSHASLAAGTPLQIRRNTINLGPFGAYEAVEVSGSKSAAKVAGNTITGGGTGSVRVGAGTYQAEIDSNSIAGALEYGIRASSATTLRIRDNVLTAVDGRFAFRGGAIYLEAGTASDALAEILRNRITGSKASGIVLYRSNSLDTVTVLVDSNTVKGADSVGIWVGYYSRANIRKNAIDSTGGDAVRLSELYHGVGQVVVDSNNFTRSRRYGVANQTTVLVDATENYWGGDQGPRGFNGRPEAALTSADSVSANVNWNFWLPAPIGTLAPVPPAFVAQAARLAAPDALSVGAWSSVPTERAEPARSGVGRVSRFERPAPRERAVPPEHSAAFEQLLEADARQAAYLRARDAERVKRLEEREARRAEAEAARASWRPS